MKNSKSIEEASQELKTAFEEFINPIIKIIEKLADWFSEKLNN